MRRIITLSIVSHTNVGKTTLARTLLRRDVGEVLDQAHVTELSEAHTLIEVGEPGEEGHGELRLWDTPGFGDSARLLKRLRRFGTPLLWFLQQTWDRITDRPLWSSQQAALNIRDEADVVLYLVNAAEEPEDAGYVAPELELLSWIGRPIVLLLNQTGEADAGSRADRLSAWRRHVERFEAVREVLALDAFSRCWVQESLLLERVVPLLNDDHRELMEELEEAWNRRNLEVFERATAAMAQYLAAGAADREELPDRKASRADKKQGMETLAARLEAATGELMSTLLGLHGLEGSAAAEIDRQLDAFAVEGEDLLDPEKGAVWGGVVSGALGGLTADILSGGLSFGGGMLAGAVLGALGGAGLARGFQLIKGEKLPEVSWSAVFLDRLADQILLRYLAVAHFGRGRGEFRDHDASQHWHELVAAALQARADEWSAVWKAAQKDGQEAGARQLRILVDETLRGVLVEGYPEASGVLRAAR
ncbi:MAG: GTPase domain-containing protein [bacterium]|nr:GTPase domain-containing protein [bacterium]